MSAKDEFFKKVQESNNTQEDLRSRVQANIMSFRAAMFDLTKQVDSWLNGSGIGVTTTEQSFRDETILMLPGCENLSSYKASFCKMQNGSKMAIIEPIGIYGGTATKGWASLAIDTPNRAPRIQKFILRLNDNGTWSIRNDDAPSSMYEPLIKPESPLTEDSFFQTISPLA
ncbi:hypothetical protein [Hafnia paralvei]|uniref:hypothetical protein n=1 Tax=Hafnia paralvei TaxID=546367 RepID=UPI0024BA373E|nr:hypothetical protein [Hafnia paralvei]